MDENKVLKKQYKITDKVFVNAADSYVDAHNKVGTAHGEKKLYVGSPATAALFGNKGFEVDCYIEKDNLLAYMANIKYEYLNPTYDYRFAKNETDSKKLYNERLEKVKKLNQIEKFTVKHVSNLKDKRRVYIRTDKDDPSRQIYDLLSELSLGNPKNEESPSRFLFLKIKTDNNEKDSFIVHLYTDYESTYGEEFNPFEIEELENEIYNDTEITETEKRQITYARKGQGKFRKALLKNKTWNFCPITLVSQKELLVASHIKPWKISSNRERLDVYNGILLTPTYDKLFDRGFITFDEKKTLKISRYLDESTISKLDLNEITINKLPLEKREKYFKYHYQDVFKGI